MPSHFSSIGLLVESEDDLRSIVESVGSDSISLPSANGNYFQWASPCGAELWIQANNENEIEGVNPHFAGPARLKARLNTYYPDSMDGAFHAWADPEDNELEGAYPLYFDAPDASRHQNLELPRIVEIQVAAFAHELTVHDDLDAFNRSQTDEELKFASESFIPSGLFGADDEGARAEAFFTGTVIASKLKTNPLHGHHYWWALVRSLGGEFDVVADPELVDQPIQVGNILQGSFWLSGRIQES